MSNELITQNRELQRQDGKPSEIGKFIQATNSKKISESTADEISGCLRYAMAKIGLRAANFPTEQDKAFLIIHLYENFGFLPVEEIKVAFDWALAERLSVDYNCYENFSCAYISRILNAYWRLAKNVKVGNEYINREQKQVENFTGSVGLLLENFKTNE